MRLKVAITTSDGKMINQHFGHCTEFTIVELDEETGQWNFAEKRQAERVCNGFSHDENYVEEVAKMLSDCSYLLTSRIGPHPYRVLHAHGVTSLEAPAQIDTALQKLYTYYKGSH